MSLTHGHYFIADGARRQLSPGLGALVERNLNAYLLGSVGPDVLYWADYGKWPFGEFELALGCDPHVQGSGEMIIALVMEYLARRRRSNKGEESALAFLLGWITHWAADLYVHTLVDAYGGVYGVATPRHLQLELVETRYIQRLRPELNALVLNSDPELALFLADAVTRAYPDSRIRPNLPGVLSSPVERTKKIADNKLEFLRFAHTGYTMIALGWDAANQGIPGAGRITAVGGTPARTVWEVSGAVLPDQAAFEGLLDPIRLETRTPTLTDIELEVALADTGLYGKFLADYPAFAEGAAFRAASIIELVHEVVSSVFPGSEGTGSTGASPSDQEAAALAVLRAAVCPQGRNVDILVPEEQFGLIDRELAERLKDATIRAQYDRSELYFRGAYALAGRDPVPFDGYTPIEPTGTHRLQGSRIGRARLRIPVDNPEQLAYSFTLGVSLTDKAAFAQPRYEQVEFRDFGEQWVAGDLITQLQRSTRLEVVYTGPLTVGSSRDGGPMTFSQGNTYAATSAISYAQQPRTVAVDVGRNGRNNEAVSIVWSGNEFEANLSSSETYLEILMPGETRKPEVAGESRRRISIKGVVDPVGKTLTVEARDRREATRRGSPEEPKETSESTVVCSAVALPFQEMSEQGDIVKFWCDQPAALQSCQVRYHAEHSSVGRFAGSTWSRTEEDCFRDTWGKEQDCCFLVRFKVEE